MLRRSLRRHVNLERLPTAPLLLYKPFHSSPTPRLLGLKLPTPSNEPLAGTVSGDVLGARSVPPFPSAQSQIETTTSALVPSPAGLILENPLPSIPYMVKALYPQKWLPYHYLGFAAFDRWDAIGRLRNLASTTRRTGGGAKQAVPSLWIRSGRDEIIPTGEEDGVEEMLHNWRKASQGRDELEEDSMARWIEVESALHDTAYLERKWSSEIVGFLRKLASQEFRSQR